jgi:hypothetical protein
MHSASGILNDKISIGVLTETDLDWLWLSLIH